MSIPLMDRQQAPEDPANNTLDYRLASNISFPKTSRLTSEPSPNQPNLMDPINWTPVDTNPLQHDPPPPPVFPQEYELNPQYDPHYSAPPNFYASHTHTQSARYNNQSHPNHYVMNPNGQINTCQSYPNYNRQTQRNCNNPDPFRVAVRCNVCNYFGNTVVKKEPSMLCVVVCVVVGVLMVPESLLLAVLFWVVMYFSCRKKVHYCQNCRHKVDMQTTQIN